MNGLPGLRLLPDAPIPDGRTVLTEPEALNSCNDPVSQAGFHGGFESRTICPRDRRPSADATTPEVPR